MKIKAIYIYLSLIIVALITLISISSSNSDTEKSKIIPNDEIHSSLNSGTMEKPSGNNVNSEFLEKMEVMQKELSKSHSDTVKIKEYADLLLAAHKEKEAVQYYEKILNVDSNRIDILKSLSIIEFESGNYNAAKDKISRLLLLEPNNPETIYNMGVIEAKIGDIEAAKKQWSDLIANHPNTKMSDIAKQSIEKLSNK